MRRATQLDTLNPLTLATGNGQQDLTNGLSYETLTSFHRDETSDNACHRTISYTR